MPRLIAASVMRSISRLRIMCAMPPPIAAEQVLRRDDAVVEHGARSSCWRACPSCASFCVVEKPGNVRSTHERRDAPVELGVDEEDVGLGRVGDERLAPR